MEDEKCGCGGEETVKRPLEDDTEEDSECCGPPQGRGVACGDEASPEDLGCCVESPEPPGDDMPCCGETLPDDVSCCSEAEQEDTGCGCGCGGDFPDESLINNPEKPESIADPDFFHQLERYAQLMGIVQVGYTHVSSELVNSEEHPQYLHAIVLTYQMGQDIIETPPGPEAQELNNATYTKLGRITYALSDFIRSRGFATQVAHPYGGLLNFSPLGQKAGLGWMGQSGLLISPELGPRMKISAILTSIENLPLKETEDYSWIPDYCTVCGKCIKACPEEAMVEKESCCGMELEFIESRCIGCSQGCTYCIEECPFHQKGYQPVKDKFDRMNAKLAEKRSKAN